MFQITISISSDSQLVCEEEWPVKLGMHSCTLVGFFSFFNINHGFIHANNLVDIVGVLQRSRVGNDHVGVCKNILRPYVGVMCTCGCVGYVCKWGRTGSGFSPSFHSLFRW